MEDRFGRSQGLHHKAIRIGPSLFEAPSDVFEVCRTVAHDKSVHLEPDPAHPERILDILLIVQAIVFWNDMNNLTIQGHSESSLHFFEDPRHIVIGHLAISTSHRYHPKRRLARDLGPRDTRHHALRRVPCHSLGLFERDVTGLGHGLSIDHCPTSNTL